MENKIKINTNDPQPAVEHTVTFNETVGEDMSRLVKANVLVSPADYQPANWHLEPIEDNLISGRNIANGKLFKGTIEEFNSFLKGN